MRKKRKSMRQGHLKDFRKGNGLFGKHKGRYWWKTKEQPKNDLRQLNLSLN